MVSDNSIEAESNASYTTKSNEQFKELIAKSLTHIFNVQKVTKKKKK